MTLVLNYLKFYYEIYTYFVTYIFKKREMKMLLYTQPDNGSLYPCLFENFQKCISKMIEYCRWGISKTLVIITKSQKYRKKAIK